MLPDPIKQLADALSKLPGVGPRQALRLAFYLSSEDRSLTSELSSSLLSISQVKLCSDCFYPHTNGKLCHICSNPSRLKNLIAVVEKATDYMSLEKTKRFNGRYLILGDLGKGGIMEPEQKLRLESLKRFLSNNFDGVAEEIILALSPTSYGDLNASMLQRELSQYTIKLTRLGRGIPTGGEIEFADDETLGAALERRL